MDKSEWIRQAMQKYERRLLRYVSRMVSEAQAREIVQETFLKLWQQDMADVRSRLAEWLYTVCRHQAIDVIRRAGHASKAMNELPAGSVLTPEEHLVKSQSQNALMRMVDQLPPDQQEVMRLKIQGELSYKEISAVTGHSVSYVGVLLHTAVMTLRERYGGKI